MRKIFILAIILFSNNIIDAQIKILFDATKAETAGNADWVIDSDLHNIGYGNGPAAIGSGNESNPQRFPSPPQSGITSSTPETYWEGSLSAWGVDCAKKGYQVETLPYNVPITYGNTSNVQDLSNYKVFIIDEPNIVFSASEKTAIMHFVQNGGGLFMISDHTVSDRNNDGWDSPHIWNDLMTNNSVQNNPFGITFDSANFSETSTNVPNLPNDSLLHGPMGNVTEVKWSNGTSMTLNTTHNSTVKAVVYKTGSTFGATGAMAAYARFGLGKVAAIGDSSPPDDGTGDPNDVLYNGWTSDAAGNHERLIMNATIWLAETNSSCTPVAANASSATVCAGASVTLTGSGAASYTWSGGIINGTAFIPTATATYSVTGTGGNSCTNAAVKTITVLPVLSSTQTLTLCAGHSITIGAAVHNTAGTFTDVLTSSTTGCDSTVTTNLTINTINNAVTVSGPALSAIAAPAAYQWLNCSSINGIIAGQTTQTFTASASGSYKVIISQNGCTDTSACYNISTTGINENSDIGGLTIFPNPSENIINISPPFPSQNFSLEIYSPLGELLVKTTDKIVIDISSFTNGIYLINIKQADKIWTRKIIKK